MTEHFVEMAKISSRLQTIVNNVSVNGDCCYLTNKTGKPKAVVLDIQYYHALMDIVEDAENTDSKNQEYAHLHKILNEIVPQPKKKKNR
jgi:PHD/YefM family antitoxin component YafN of YafNO toxin-antitoxin module